MITAVIMGSRKRSTVREYLEEKKRARETGDANGVIAKIDKEIEKAQASDKFLVNQIISNLMNRYRTELEILTCACDDGIGLIVKSTCEERNIMSAELVWYFHGRKWEPQEASKCYLARAATYLERGDIFALLIDDSRQGIAEDMLMRLRHAKEHSENGDGTDRPYIVLDQRGQVIEAHKQGAIL